MSMFNTTDLNGRPTWPGRHDGHEVRAAECQDDHQPQFARTVGPEPRANVEPTKHNRESISGGGVKGRPSTKASGAQTGEILKLLRLLFSCVKAGSLGRSSEVGLGTFSGLLDLGSSEVQDRKTRKAPIQANNFEGIRVVETILKLVCKLDVQETTGMRSNQDRNCNVHLLHHVLSWGLGFDDSSIKHLPMTPLLS